MRAASIDLPALARNHNREAEESERIRRRALDAARRAAEVAEGIERMNRIYRERLDGTRKGEAKQ